MHGTEPRSRQGPPLQPLSGLVYLEEAQHAQPPPLPVICCTCFSCTLSRIVSLSLRSCPLMLVMDVCLRAACQKQLVRLQWTTPRACAYTRKSDVASGANDHHLGDVWGGRSCLSISTCACVNNTVTGSRERREATGNAEQHEADTFRLLVAPQCAERDGFDHQYDVFSCPPWELRSRTSLVRIRCGLPSLSSELCIDLDILRLADDLFAHDFDDTG